MKGKYKDYVVVSVKMPAGLRDKIKRLASGRGVTFNSWVVRTLVRDARWKGD